VVSARLHRYRRGDRVDGHPYEILCPLPESGRGATYEVLDLDAGAVRILKTFPAAARGEGGEIDRLRDAARDVARVRERRPDGVAEVLLVGRTEDAHRLPFVVMEKLDGATLRDALNERGHLPARDACMVAAGILEALADAHDAGVMHFAVKPENVFVEARERGPLRVKLLDFGALSASEDARAEVRALARYSAPEQLRRGGLRTSVHSDVYAVGLVLYECLAGRGPFDDRARCSDLVEAQLYAAAPPLGPSARDVTPALEQLVLSALAKEPSARPMSAHTFIAQLAELQLAPPRRQSFGPTAPPGIDFEQILARERPRALRAATTVRASTPAAPAPPEAPRDPRNGTRRKLASDLVLAALCATLWMTGGGARGPAEAASAGPAPVDAAGPSIGDELAAPIAPPVATSPSPEPPAKVARPAPASAPRGTPSHPPHASHAPREAAPPSTIHASSRPRDAKTTDRSVVTGADGPEPTLVSPASTRQRPRPRRLPASGL